MNWNELRIVVSGSSRLAVRLPRLTVTPRVGSGTGILGFAWNNWLTRSVLRWHAHYSVMEVNREVGSYKGKIKGRTSRLSYGQSTTNYRVNYGWPRLTVVTQFSFEGNFALGFVDLVLKTLGTTYWWPITRPLVRDVWANIPLQIVWITYGLQIKSDIGWCEVRWYPITIGRTKACGKDINGLITPTIEPWKVVRRGQSLT